MARDHYYTRDMQPGFDGQPVKKSGGAIARFENDEVEDIAKSTALGRKAYRPITVVEIINPGDPQNIVRRRVREEDKERFPQAWAAFEKMEEFTPDGTLLEHFPMVSKGQIHNLKSNEIYTIEQLAGVPDMALQHLGLGARRLREHAKAYLETAEKNKVPARLVEDNEQLRNQVKLLTAQISAITDKLEIYAAKAGADVSQIDNEAGEVVAAVERRNAELSRNLLSDLPENWEFTSLPEMKQFAMRVTDEKIKSKVHAVEVIKEYLDSRVA